MGRTAIYIHTVVQTGGRIEIAAPSGMREGDEVDVVLLTDGRVVGAPTQCLLEILDSLPRGIGIFKSAEEVDAHIRHERDSWEP